MFYMRIASAQQNYIPVCSIQPMAGQIIRISQGGRARKGRTYNRRKEEGSLGCRFVAGSDSLARTLSECVQREHLDYH